MIDKLFCLPYLPADIIPEAFESLASTAADDLRCLFTYISSVWIYSSIWPPTSWSVYGKFIRTNNDSEGLHNAWNSQAGHNVRFYKLILFLFKKATKVPLNAKLLAHYHIKRKQRSSQIVKDQKLDRIWKKYDQKQLSNDELLSCLVLVLRVKPLTAEMYVDDGLEYDRYVIDP